MAVAMPSTARHYGTLVALILAGELIFSLPFHIPRFFRPSMLEAFQLSNTQLGDIFAVYGVVALLAYFPGGTLADRYPARTLIALSLAATSLGGFYLYTLPGINGLYLLFAYWGLTSILLFWAALIKATRDWGGAQEQGIAFGILDGGRGLVASVFATVALIIMGRILNDSGSGAAGMQGVILFYSIISVLCALLVWCTLPSGQPPNRTIDASAMSVATPRWRTVICERKVWLQAGVVVCAYCGYKSLDNYGVYAVTVLGMTPVEAAELTALISYTRPVAAIIAGLWADRWQPSKVILLLFGGAAVAFFAMSMNFLEGPATGILLGNMIVTFIAVYALRGIYFSLIEESGVDKRVTGTAVGIISVLGFAPDIFFGALTGRLLDANPGAAGFTHYFLVMACISILGMVFTWRLSRRVT
jgi:nitrate/nitrite transporter NarK